MGARIGHRPLRGGDDRRVGRRVRIADPEADHVDARGALGGDLALELGEQVRRDPLQAPTRSHAAPLRTRRRACPRNTGTAQPVRLMCRSSPTSTSSSPPSSTTVTGESPPCEHVGDRGAGGAGAAGRGLPHPALEDPRADPAGPQRPRTTRRWCGSGTARGARSPGRSRAGRAPSSSCSLATRIAHCGLPTWTC